MDNKGKGRVRFTKKKLTRTPASSGKPRCPECGYRVRGSNHEAGDHHAAGRATASKQGWRWNLDGRVLTKVASNSRRSRGH